MSAVDDLTDEEYGPDGGLIETIDEAIPCCTLCGDDARWENGMVCICMGWGEDDPVP